SRVRCAACFPARGVVASASAATEISPRPCTMDQSARRAALKPVLDESRTYLANLFATTSWSDKPEMLGPIHRPVTLGPDAFQYKIRFLRGLASHPMKGKTARVKYTFFLATPLGGLKERFIAEINNKAAGEAYDQGFIGRYYLPFVPGR